MDARAPQTIGEVAKAFKLTLRALRFYEQKGLIAPERDRGGQRRYRPEDIRRIHLITSWTSVGATIAQVKDLLRRWEAADFAGKEAVNQEVDAIAFKAYEAAAKQLDAVKEWRERRRKLAAGED